MAFRQIHETLIMEALPTPRFKRGLSAGASNRKRRRDESGNEVDADGSEGEKKTLVPALVGIKGWETRP